MTDRERKAMQMALDALDSCEFDYDWEERPYKTFDEDLRHDAVDALRQALAQPEQEPVAWLEHEWSGSGLRHLHFDRRKPTLRDEVLNPVWTPLYTAPPSKPWVSLTDEELEYIYKQNHNQYGEDITGEYERELEAKLREKNT